MLSRNLKGGKINQDQLIRSGVGGSRSLVSRSKVIAQLCLAGEKTRHDSSNH